MCLRSVVTFSALRGSLDTDTSPTNSSTARFLSTQSIRSNSIPVDDVSLCVLVCRHSIIFIIAYIKSMAPTVIIVTHHQVSPSPSSQHITVVITISITIASAITVTITITIASAITSVSLTNQWDWVPIPGWLANSLAGQYPISAAPCDA